MYALCEPYVIYSQVQEEAMKVGLYTLVCGGGGQISVVANTINVGTSPLGYRLGWVHRRILAVEWILPDGEIVRLGSAALNKDEYFWGEGLGPDLRGILRGTMGWWGSLGIVTKIAIKLHPFVPEKPTPLGVTPQTSLQFPIDRMRWYNITFPDEVSMVTAMRECSKAEIGATVMRVPKMWRIRAKAKSREHFWNLWLNEAKEELKNDTTQIMRVLLVGYTNKKQLEYEEEILKEIVEENGGEMRKTRQSDESMIKSADTARMWWVSGGYISIKLGWDCFDHAIVNGRSTYELAKKYIPPLVDEYGDIGWFQLVDWGHGGYIEFLINYDVLDKEASKKADQLFVDCCKQDIQKNYWTSVQSSFGPTSLIGPAYDNHLTYLRGIKRLFDPKNLSNPPRPEDYDVLLDEHQDWVKVDWRRKGEY
jgi:glycolate oxidase